MFNKTPLTLSAFDIVFKNIHKLNRRRTAQCTHNEKTLQIQVIEVLELNFEKL